MLRLKNPQSTSSALHLPTTCYLLTTTQLTVMFLRNSVKKKKLLANMKKLLKFVGTVAAISAVVAGGVALYKKFFAPEEDFSDLDDDFDDEFEEEDLDSEPHTERGYVSLNNTAETVKEKAEEAGETVKEAAEEMKETVTEAAEE